MTTRQSSLVACAATAVTGVVVLVLATGIVLLLVVQIINVIVFSYGKGTVRTALDEAARAGARRRFVACVRRPAIR